MSESVRRFRPSAKAAARYRDVWLPSISVTRASTVERLTQVFAQGDIELTDELRKALESP